MACYKCHGTGLMTCPNCLGAGKLNEDGDMDAECPYCEGNGERCCNRCTAGIGDIEDNDD